MKILRTECSYPRCKNPPMYGYKQCHGHVELSRVKGTYYGRAREAYRTGARCD